MAFRWLAQLEHKDIGNWSSFIALSTYLLCNRQIKGTTEPINNTFHGSVIAMHNLIQREHLHALIQVDFVRVVHLINLSSNGKDSIEGYSC